MFEHRVGRQRGGFDFGWLRTLHSFSFGQYYDPQRMGWRSLRVINEDWVQPGQGFGTHPHKDMEILTWVLEGALEHKDSTGTHGIIRPGDAQVMSAGTGITHSEFNASDAEEVHLLQIWVLPERRNLPPRYGQTSFEPARFDGRWGLIASHDGRDGSTVMVQDMDLWVGRLAPGATLEVGLQPGRGAYLHVAKGRVQAAGRTLEAGDALLAEGEAPFAVTAETDAEVLWFDLG